MWAAPTSRSSLAAGRVELGEIDKALIQLPGVASAAAAVQTTPSGNKVLAGYLVAEPGQVPDLAACRAQLARVLPAQLVPSLGIVDELPVKTSGKVDRKALPWPLLAAEAGTAGHNLTGTEGWIADTWQDLLGAVPLDGNSDFFALGGASVAAAQLVSVLRTRHPEASLPTFTPNQPSAASPPTSIPKHHGSRETRYTPDSVVDGTGSGSTGRGPVCHRWVAVCHWHGPGLLAFVQLHRRNVDAKPPAVAGAGGLGCALRVAIPGTFRCCHIPTIAVGNCPGEYRRGGGTHLRLWAAERIVTFCKLEPIMGSQLGIWYARALGCKIGDEVHLDAMPPVTGLAVIGSGSSIEYEVDLAGHWLDGDTLSIGRITIGANCRGAPDPPSAAVQCSKTDQRSKRAPV